MLKGTSLSVHSALKSRLGTLTLDERGVPLRPPYNLSTGYNWRQMNK